MSTIAMNALLQTYAPYPAPIRPFLLRADTHPTLRSLLTKSGMSVFLDIIGRAPIHDPARPIKVRVDKVASDINRSEKTVQRVLRLLQENGWLIRSPGHDGRNYRGKFSHREFLVGDVLRKMIGLPTLDAPNTTHDFVSELPQIVPPAASDLTKTEMSDGIDGAQPDDPILHQKIVDNTKFSPVMSDGHIGVNKTLKEVALKEASIEKSESKKTERVIPHDLIALQTELEVSKGGICKLMEIAAAHKQRLQDVWLAKKATILKSGAKQGRAFNYLKALILAGEDFSFVAKQQSRIENVTKTDQKASDRKMFWHKKYSGMNGLRVRVFDGTAEVSVSTLDSRFIPAADMDSLYEAIEAGKLREIIE